MFDNVTKYLKLGILSTPAQILGILKADFLLYFLKYPLLRYLNATIFTKRALISQGRRPIPSKKKKKSAIV